MTDPGAAPAKINLCLHVTGQRADGYHLLDSLVAFAPDAADRLTLAPASATTLTLTGPEATALAPEADNLVLRAARSFGASLPAVALHLEKNLPVASGIGGGSADAAAALRLCAAHAGLPLPDAAVILSLGADVPVCLRPRATRMEGIGERLTPLPPLPPVHAVLVNPRRPVATPAIFRALTQRNNAPLPATIPTFADARALAHWLARQRNDLEGPARLLEPVISDVLAAIAARPGCLLARMSGSGATCFGLFADAAQAGTAARALRHAQPEWWVATSVLV